MTRQDILEAAAQIFSEKGYHAASMQDIADAVKLQKASLYHHVTSKQEILLALLEQAMELLNDRLTQVVALPLPPDQKLRIAIRSYLEILTDHREVAAVLLFEHRSLEPELAHRHVPQRDRFEGLWRALIQEGLEQGIFSCAHPALAARALLGEMNWTLTWYRPGGPLSAREISESYAEMFLRGLLARNGGKGGRTGF